MRFSSAVVLALIALPATAPFAHTQRYLVCGPYPRHRHDRAREAVPLPARLHPLQWSLWILRERLVPAAE
jgi:hypothetical protein